MSLQIRTFSGIMWYYIILLGLSCCPKSNGGVYKTTWKEKDAPYILDDLDNMSCTTTTTPDKYWTLQYDRLFHSHTESLRLLAGTPEFFEVMGHIVSREYQLWDTNCDFLRSQPSHCTNDSAPCHSSIRSNSIFSLPQTERLALHTRSFRSKQNTVLFLDFCSNFTGTRFGAIFASNGATKLEENQAAVMSIISTGYSVYTWEDLPLKFKNSLETGWLQCPPTNTSGQIISPSFIILLFSFIQFLLSINLNEFH